MNRPAEQAPARPPRRRGWVSRIIRRILVLLVLIALIVTLVRYWPYLYQRFFGNNTKYISERFSEVVKDQNRMEVLSDTVEGQETAKMDAFILGTVQQVVIPYSFTIGFFVDYDKVTITTEGNTIVVSVPPPYADYHKLTVDEENVRKSDFLVPLTTERYAQILSETEKKLFDELSAKQEFLDRAWQSNEENLRSLFKALLANINPGQQSEFEMNIVKQQPLAPPPEDTPQPTGAELSGSRFRIQSTNKVIFRLIEPLIS